MSPRGAQTGLSLVELLIGSAIGMIVSLAASTMYVNTSRASAQSLRQTQLQHELQQILNLMIADLRRAGYRGHTGHDPNHHNPFALRTAGNATDLFVHPQCVLYSYDFNDNGQPDATGGAGHEFFGFRFDRTRGLVQILNPNSALADTSQPCTGAGWLALSDPASVRITDLRFSTGCLTGTDDIPGCADASRCLNTSRPGTAWSAPADSTLAPCDATSTTEANGWQAPTPGDRLIELRLINIQIAGHIPAQPEISLRMHETVQLRNHRIIIQ